jgi:hypothetical protein
MQRSRALFVGSQVILLCYLILIYFTHPHTVIYHNISQGKHLRECFSFILTILPYFVQFSSGHPSAFKHLLLLRTFVMWAACGLQLAVSEDVAHQQRSHLLRAMRQMAFMTLEDVKQMNWPLNIHGITSSSQHHSFKHSSLGYPNVT